MAQIVYAVAPSSAESNFWTTRLSRPVRMGPKSSVHCKSATMVLKNVTEIETGVNDTFVVQLVSGDLNSQVLVIVPAGEYASSADLAAAIQNAFNNQIPGLQIVGDTGQPENVYASCMCSFNAPAFIFTVLGPQQPQPFPDDPLSEFSTTAQWTPGQPVGTSIQRTAPGAADWYGWVRVLTAGSAGSSQLSCQVDPAAPAGWAGMLGYRAPTGADTDPTEPNTTTVAIVMTLGAPPEILVNGQVVAPNGAVGGVVAAGDVFRIFRLAGNIGFVRVVGANEVLMHNAGAIDLRAQLAFGSIFAGGVLAGLRWTPGIRPVQGPALNQLGAVNPNSVKSIVFGALGEATGFVPQKTYTAAAGATAVFTSDTPILLQNTYPSVQILVRNLPLLAWDGNTGRPAPIVASVPKVALMQLQDGQQLLYTDPAPTPIACRFADEQSITELVLELQDTDGDRVETTGRTQIVLVITNPV